MLQHDDDDDDADDYYCMGKQRRVNHPPVKQSITNKHYYTYRTWRLIHQKNLHAILFEQHEKVIHQQYTLL